MHTEAIYCEVNMNKSDRNTNIKRRKKLYY